MDRARIENWDGSEAVEQKVKMSGITAKKMVVISSTLFGSIAFLLWAMLGFPKKSKNPRIFKFEKMCSWKTTTCPQGWNHIHNNCFFQFELEKTWIDGQANCMAYHGSLEILTHSLGPSTYWIGLRKQNASNHWMWENGDALSNWFTIEGNGNCAFIFKMGISSANCDEKRKYICSRKGLCP
uniref:C-type lectin domain-containing protein n=1 Tax=Rousettus aegyptiacus TaxID=9407 RepID=A0A7J8JI88_ROUAE|nr:hypothetical protein HJG63_010303 [Rousettus aegyptiacus]